MPRYADPALPNSVEAAVDVLGINRVRLVVILQLAASPAPMTTTELATVTATNSVTVNRHLRELEAAGAVVASKPADDPSRRRSSIRWRLNTDLVRGHLLEVLRLL